MVLCSVKLSMKQLPEARVEKFAKTYVLVDNKSIEAFDSPEPESGQAYKNLKK